MYHCEFIALLLLILNEIISPIHSQTPASDPFTITVDPERMLTMEPVTSPIDPPTTATDSPPTININGVDLKDYRSNIEKYLNITYFNVKLTDIDVSNSMAIADTLLKAGESRDKTTLFFILQHDPKDLDKIEEKLREIDLQYRGMAGTPMIKEGYSPHNNNCRDDLIFSIIRDPMEVKIGYLTSLLIDNQKYEYGQLLMQMLIIEDTDRKALIDEYNKGSELTFDESIELFHEDDYKNFLLELSRRIRAPDVDNVNQQEVDDVVKRLNKERKGRKGWKDDRDTLDDVLMARPRKFARAVIKKYAEKNDGNQLKDDIDKKLDEKNLQIGYRSLVDYIQDPHAYMASRIHDSVDEYRDFRATFFQLIVMYRNSPDLIKINEAFMKLYQMTLGNFLLDVNEKTSCAKDVICLTINYLIFTKL